MHNPLDDFSFSDPFETWWPFILALIVGVVTAIRSYISGPSCPSTSHVDGKVVIITGGSRGVGADVVLELVKRGAKVVIGTRDPKRAQEEIGKRIKSNQAQNIKTIYLDLSNMESILNFVQSINESKVDILINNAGIAFHPRERTKENLEMHLAVNYIGHFLLIHKLLPKLKAAQQARIINTSAHAHSKSDIDLTDLNCEKNFSSARAFANSKLAVILMTRYLANCWQAKSINVTINSVNPGIVRGTGHVSNSIVSKSYAFKFMAAPTLWLFTKTPLEASQTIIYLAVAEEVKDLSGRYFSNCSEIEPCEKAMDAEFGRKLYKKTWELIRQNTHEEDSER